MSGTLRSTALEPAPGTLRRASLGRRLAALLPVYGLVILAVLLALAFSAVLPKTFPTWLNARSILSDKAVVAMLSLAATVPMMTGKIDLTVGYGVVLWHVLAISLQIAGVPWPFAVLIVLALGLLFGLLNGLLVEVAQIDSFIATLGTGTLTYAVALWWTGGRQIIGRLSPSFFQIDTASLLGIPVPAFYVLGLAIAAVGGVGLHARRALSLCDRRQSARGRTQRHSDAALRHARLHDLGRAHGLCGRRYWRRGCGSARRASGSSSSCPRSLEPSSARRRSTRAGSTSGAPSSAWLFSPSGFPVSSSSAAHSGSSRPSTARPC